MAVLQRCSGKDVGNKKVTENGKPSKEGEEIETEKGQPSCTPHLRHSTPYPSDILPDNPKGNPRQ